jgi:putative N6-adenine-specific DNA methylase
MPEFIAKTLFGLEEVLAEELRNLGAREVKTYHRAVGFTGDSKMLYKANYHLRTALKILVPLGEDTINNETELYNYVRSVRWDRYIGVNDTLAVDVAMKTDIFRHTQYIAQKIKDAIVDQFRDKYGARPSVDLDHPTLRINAYISDRTIKLSRDSSGDSLHRRGYRYKQGPAPMNEVLAAGLIKLSGWNGHEPLVDFMCGSGTIAIEAALSAARIPPGDLRSDYGFQKWKDYDPKLFQEVVHEVKRKTGFSGFSVYAADITPESVHLATRHAQNAGVLKMIDFRTGHFSDYVPPPPPGVVVINPPYGERINQENLNELYTQIGDKLKKAFTGYEAWIISSNAEAMKHIGLRPSKKITVFNGQLECRFNRYSLYEGSKKAEKSDDS